MTRSDAELVADPRTQAVRKKIAPLLAMYRAEAEASAMILPSYVRQPLTDLFASFDRWRLEESGHAGS